MNTRRLGLTLLFVCLALAALSTPAAADETLEGSTINASAQQEATNLERLETVADRAGLSAPTNAMLFIDDSGDAYLVGTAQQTRPGRSRFLPAVS
ncbi:hypothetical protein NDI56_20160 [Haloarcula sp. S1CR25-12]|uniref:Uncharacterized protein n=1 Tax=Haloarcula saliterrae TaxID=2950534 RepID=A0ABU2FIW4_9EURY|nr:hypothetical protein [Haloarcula sp. S1CR25-12]MDS0261721.1 hypothetical protein [Haloarcula sp. S1CR25-12]